MVGIVYATRREADPFLLQTAAEPLATQPLSLFQISTQRYPPCIVVISGMGKVAAAVAATHLVLDHRVALLINAGLCGRLTMDDRWLAGDLFGISSAVEGDCDRFGRAEQAVTCDNGCFSQLKSARLVTCDRPVFDAARRIRLAAMGDLIDMEGTAVARVAGFYGIPCAMVKGISDLADETGRQDVAANIDRVSGSIADVLVRELELKATVKPLCNKTLP